MFHPSKHAQHAPDKAAIILAETGDVLTYGDLDRRSNQFAQFLRAQGCCIGDTIALYVENCLELFPIVWGAQRAGLYYVCISTRLTVDEIDHIIADSAAKLLIVSAQAGPDWHEFAKRYPALPIYSVGTELGGTIKPLEAQLAALPDTPIADEASGTDMLYSSGTTGKPKGVRVALNGLPIDAPVPILKIVDGLYDINGEDVYLCPAPLYHAAPLRWTMAMQRIGATAVVMKHFDPVRLLDMIKQHRITVCQLVPTMFVRLLKIDESMRQDFDVSSLRVAIHAAAPCPIPIKHQMIQWWGPIIHEYYAGTEGNGLCSISAPEWLTHEGSVGKAFQGVLHICDEEGKELGPNQDGTVYFSGVRAFEYHNDPVKTRESRHPTQEGWSTLGDVGHVDNEGYLYLTDRKAFMIISGGVNIYPQETENVLITHPKVADVAVIGVPDEDFGEAVKAIVQPANWEDAGDELAAELIAFARANLSPIKCPKSVDFEIELPRAPTGKLYKRLLRDRYWADAAATKPKAAA
ncbi:acyl-CoA synthetase [Blastomonas sp. UPD001]|uniref:acyl-CoA synthetase n=1 Tax=Blastomonas sp. UPD001 TaxID=2217673 RepID=UPI000E343854|nr:acyl-CoA synthetase [Blastomonas sp. UPD001]